MWFNIYNGVYDELTSSKTTSGYLELLPALLTKHQDIDGCTKLFNLISFFEISILCSVEKDLLESINLIFSNFAEDSSRLANGRVKIVPNS
jgi:hypothetical protein